MIEINTPKILSKTQAYKFKSLQMIAGEEGMRAVVVFNLFGDEGQHLGEESITYSGADFDAFWASFASGKFLYDELVSKKGFVVEVPAEVEQEFKGNVQN